MPRFARALPPLALALSAIACGAPPPTRPHVVEVAPAAPSEPECTASPEACHARADRLRQEGEHAEALALHREACEGGYPPACTAVGDAHAESLGTSRNGGEAARHYDRACDAGEELACARLAAAYVHGDLALEHDLARGLALSKRTCEAGRPEGCRVLSFLYRGGVGVAEDVERSHALLEGACRGGDFEACSDLGWRLEHAEGGYDHDIAGALAAYERGCEGGHGGACANLGYLHFRGFGPKRDLDAAHRFDRRSCRLGSSWGCANIGYHYAVGVSVAPDPELAVRHTAQACRALATRACQNLTILRERPDTEAMARGAHERAAKLLGQLCEAGDRRACRALESLVKPSSVFDLEAVERGERLCREGDAAACNYAGWHYEMGDYDLLPDAARAAALYEKSCAGDNPLGCTNWGWALQRGFGVAVDMQAAAEAYRRACDAAQEHGCNNLGWLHERGFGVEIDLDRAAALYDEACIDEHRLGCGNLGRLQRKRRHPSARAALARACALDHVSSCLWLGQMLLEGEGGDRNESHAIELLDRACALHHPLACGLRNAHQ